jgi:hypothetical protein
MFLEQLAFQLTAAGKVANSNIAGVISAEAV